MTHSLTIDQAPAYELVLSLAVFLDRQRWKTIDLGAAWGAEAERRLGPEGKAQMKAIKDPRLLHLLFPLVHQAPGDRTPEAFMAWLGSLAAGDLYERLLPCAPPGNSGDLPPDLGLWRDRMLAALRLWHECYFRELDPAILAHLAADAAAREAQAAHTPVLDLVAEATNGLHLEDDDLQQVLLVPQYHMSPWNVGLKGKGLWVILYPAEPMQDDTDRPPTPLLRLTRALSDENRLRILRFLGREPLGLNELTERTGLAKSTVHHHMVMLRAAGLVIIREKGADGRYDLRPGWLDQLTGRLSAFVVDP